MRPDPAVDDRPRSALRELFTIERPPPPTPAVRRLRGLIALAAVATVVVDLVNLGYAEEGGFGLGVRTVWALLRALGFLFLMRTVRYGRLISRPFGLILAGTTIFAVGRLVVPRHGELVPQGPVLAGFAVLALICGAIVWQLYRSPAIADFLTRRPRRRQIPPWVLAVRVAGLSLSALLLVPALVALGTLFGEPRVPLALAVPVVVGWLAWAFMLGFFVPWIMIFVILGQRWARGVLYVVTLVVLAGGPVLCWWLLGVDGLLRDGIPVVIAAGLALYGLVASRHEPRGVASAAPQ